MLFRSVTDIASSAFADLTVTQVDAPASVASGEKFTVSWTVENTNDAWGTTSAGPLTDRVVLSSDNIFGNSDDIILGEIASSSIIPVGGTYSKSLLLTLPQHVDGSYFIMIMTDVYNQVYEFNYENNNVRGPPILINAADLAPSSMTIIARVSSQETTNVSYTIQNQGNGQTTTGWWDYFYLSNDETLDNSDLYIDQHWNSTSVEIGRASCRERV